MGAGLPAGPDRARELKSLQPTAARLGLRSHDQLHRFATSTTWDDASLHRILVKQADALVGGPDAVLVVDDTALPKQGKRSVGVARQYCGCLDKRATCRVLMLLTLAKDEVPVPVGLRDQACQMPGSPTQIVALRPASRQSTSKPWRRPTSH